MRLNNKYTLIIVALCGAYLLFSSNMAEKEAAQQRAETLATEQAALKPPTISFDIAGSALVLEDAVKALAELSAAEREWVAQYVQAVNQQDEQQLRSLIHPDSLACLDAVDERYQSYQMARELNFDIPTRYWLYFRPYQQVYEASIAHAQQTWLRDPAEHTHTMMMHYKGGAFGSETILRKVQKREDGIYLVLGCPTELMVSQYVRGLEERQRLDAAVEELYGLLEEDEKHAIFVALEQGGMAEALEYYKSKHPGVDIEVVQVLVERLHEEMLESRPSDAERSLDAQSSEPNRKEPTGGQQ